jgi:hypothetical protein
MRQVKRLSDIHREVWTWLDDHCRAAPSKLFAEAVMAWLSEQTRNAIKRQK